MLKKSKMCVRKKFLVDGVAEGCQNHPSANFDHIIDLKGMSIWKKQQIYDNFRLFNVKNSKIMIALLLVMNVPYSTRFCMRCINKTKFSHKKFSADLFSFFLSLTRRDKNIIRIWLKLPVETEMWFPTTFPCMVIK